MNQESDHLAVTANVEPTGDFAALNSHRFETTNLLQTTLVPDQLLALFSKQMQKIVPHSGFQFNNEKLGLHIKGGQSANHSCSYKLMIENEMLGEFKLMRRTRFSNEEIAKAEVVLCCLLYPLRNALLYRQALQSAYTDLLTGTFNRTALGTSFHREWKLACRQNTPLSIILLDIDHFKRVNDNHGHLCGDRVLKQMADCIKEVMRASDLIFRYGGEEFLILLNNTDKTGAIQLAERIRTAIETLDWRSVAEGLGLTVSLGVATLNVYEPKDELLLRADQALYQAKQKGRNRVVAA